MEIISRKRCYCAVKQLGHTGRTQYLGLYYLYIFLGGLSLAKEVLLSHPKAGDIFAVHETGACIFCIYFRGIILRWRCYWAIQKLEIYWQYMIRGLTLFVYILGGLSCDGGVTEPSKSWRYTGSTRNGGLHFLYIFLGGLSCEGGVTEPSKSWRYTGSTWYGGIHHVYVL